KILGRVQAIIFGITGYLILLIQQIPGIWIWAPLMAAPVILLLSALASNLPTSITEAYVSFFNFNEVFFGKVLIIISIVIIIYSVVYLAANKKQGLVTTGPYRFIRHPQYLGFLLLTIGFTGWSYFYITSFFGTSWLSAEETVALWYLELLAYIVLAVIEDQYLLKKFGPEYVSYKSNTPLLIPFLKTGKLDSLISMITFSIILFVVIQFPFT
ncbi:MAG: methyltransferase family protein, partial [Candidatus Hodarchaeota archaeon]